MTKPWDVYEAIIKDLYADNTLSVVRQIMIDQYGFRASVRAYRGRLIRWGVRKYNCRKRASPSESNSSADEGSSFTSGSDTASPIMTAAAAAAIGDTRAILPRVMMKQGDADGHLAMPVRTNQQYSQNHQHQHQHQVFSTDNSFDSKPKAFLSAPQHNGNGNGGNSDGIQYVWGTPLLKKDRDAADLDDFASSQQGEAPAPPPSYFGGLPVSMMQPGNGNNKPSYGPGYGGSTPAHHQHHQSTGGGNLNYYNPSPSQQQQVRNGVVAVSQVPSDMSFAAQTRGYGHGS